MQFLIFWACDINCKSPLRLCANGRNIVGQQLPTLLDVTCCVCLHTLLHFVGYCYIVCWGFPLSLKTNTFKFQLDLEHTDTFQRVLMNSLVLRGLILLRPFAHHYQHTCNNSQHWWRNNDGGCCFRLHAALGVKIDSSDINFLKAQLSLDRPF